MPTIDDLLKQLGKENKLAQDFESLALEIKDNEDLSNFLRLLAKEEETLANKFANKINHLLEIEKW